MGQADFIAETFAAFAQEVATRPTLTLRAGNAVDEYKHPPPFDESLDTLSDPYLEQYFWGMRYLDADSWRHILPYCIDYALRHQTQGSNVTDALLNSLRPPDREPPRLGSLSPAQESVIIRFLEILAFSERSADQALACQVLEEWWIPDALYRPPLESS